MAFHNIVGQLGEELALSWLKTHGFLILHRNWRHSYYEIDIIAKKGAVLHFIEVKTRTSPKWGYPEETVDKKKFNRLLTAADAFLYRHREYRLVQYDVLAISKYRDAPPEFFLLEDIYL